MFPKMATNTLVFYGRNSPSASAAPSGSANIGSDHPSANNNKNGDNSGYSAPSTGNAKKGKKGKKGKKDKKDKKKKKSKAMLNTWSTTWDWESISGSEGLYAAYQLDPSAGQGGQ